MALKFLNKKGWHTGSLRNIENVWKAEQKHGAEQKKLEELRKQIQEERERSEFRQLQEQAGLVPRQERLDFLYESGLAVGKGSEGFKALEAPTAAAATASSASADASSSKAVVPGALFEDKPQAANDAWRKLHSDPLLQIRQREQEALARVKNNPIQMAMIRKSVEAEKNKKDKKEKREKKKHKRKHHHKKKSARNSDSEDTSGSEEDGRKRNRVASAPQERSKRKHQSIATSEDVEERRKSDRSTSDRHKDKSLNHEKHSSRVRSSDSRYSSESEEDRRKSGDSTYEHHRQHSHSRNSSRLPDRDVERRKHETYTSDHSRRFEPGVEGHKNNENQAQNQQGPAYSRRKGVPRMTDEEREARLREMQLDAELHEDQRWKRIKRAAEADAQEAAQASSARGKNFLDEAQKSIYGAEKGGSSTIEESVRRRAYYSQGGTAAHESNAFRR